MGSSRVRVACLEQRCEENMALIRGNTISRSACNVSPLMGLLLYFDSCLTQFEKKWFCFLAGKRRWGAMIISWLLAVDQA